MAVVSANGVAAPYDEPEAYGAFGARTPALRSFRLTHGSQRELALIGVLPGGESQDLSPIAQQPHVEVPDGRLNVYFQDAHPTGDEEFRWDVAHSAIRIPTARRYQIRDVGCRGECRRQVPFFVLGGISALRRPILAIVGFRLNFIGARDHNIDRIGVWFTGGTLNVAFNDRNADDEFAYLVDFVAIPDIGLTVTTGELNGQNATGYDTVPLATPRRSTFMLTGFDLNHQQGDREVRDIGVYRRDGDLTVIHTDDTGTAPFDWRVSFAHVGPQVFAEGGVRSNFEELPAIGRDGDDSNRS